MRLTDDRKPKRKKVSMPNRKKVRKTIKDLLIEYKITASARGSTEGQEITLDTPCRDFFPNDRNRLYLTIGVPIMCKFRLERVTFASGLFDHNFVINNESFGRAFYIKYPNEWVKTPEFTLAKFAEMVYDLIRIKNGLPPS